MADRELFSLTGSSHARERIVERVLLVCALVSILTTIGILAVLVIETWGFFEVVSIGDFLFDTEWTPLFADAHFGIWPLAAGTALTAGIAMMVALPFGLLAAIYLGEFASPLVRSWLKPALELLAGIPSIVYGYFALVFLTPILQSFIPDLAGFNALSPGLVMGVMIIPMISSLSEDAIRAVPNTLREASYALGANKMQTIFRVVLPTSASGIGAAVILAMSRAVGETMIVAIAAGLQPRLTFDPRVPIETMTAYIVQVGLGDTPSGSLAHRAIFVVGAGLFVLTFAFNATSQWLTRRYRGGV